MSVIHLTHRNKLRVRENEEMGMSQMREKDKTSEKEPRKWIQQRRNLNVLVYKDIACSLERTVLIKFHMK